MHFITSKLKKFDFHRKTASETQSQTIPGALVTITTFFVVSILLYSTLFSYLSVGDVENHMVTDRGIGIEDVTIVFDVEFFHVDCSRLSLKHEVSRGNLHANMAEEMSKVDVDYPDSGMAKKGCRTKGSITTGKVGGHFQFVVEPEQSPESMQRKRDREMQQAMNLALGIMFNFEQPITPDLSHFVHDVSFVPYNLQTKRMEVDPKLIADTHSPLQSIGTNLTDGNVAVYHYNIQVVPTHHNYLDDKIMVNQYSFTERNVTQSSMSSGISLQWVQFKNTFGVVFTYDFYPVMLVLEANKEGIFDFATNLCAIIGGVITVLGLLDGCIHQSTKALIGKKD